MKEFPTPSAVVYGSSGNGEGNNVDSRGRASLETMARKDLWPTPTTQDAANNGGAAQMERNSLPLNAAINRWPTPTAGDAHSSGSRNLEGSKAHAGVSLTDAVKSGGSTTPRAELGSGRLNPEWVEWLMGWPIGRTSLEPLQDLRWEPLDTEPDIARTTTDKTNRVSRIRALGNGQVPQCAALAWKKLCETP